VKPSFLFIRTCIEIGFLCGILVGCSGVTLSNIPKKPLPSSPPALSELTLALPPEGGPRRPVDSSGPSAFQANAPTIIIVEEDPTPLQTVAEQDARVREHLGDRFGFIGHEDVPTDHCLIHGEENPPSPSLSDGHSTDDKTHRLTYYSYSHNSAIHVCLQGNHVTNVQRDPRQGYQPQEGPEEVEQAIALARKDARIAQDVQNLPGHAILTSPEEYRYFWVSNEAGFGDRVLWVTFSEMPESLALFFARVDLTNGQVLDAGKEPGPQ